MGVTAVEAICGRIRPREHSPPAGLIETVLSCLLHDIGKPVQRAPASATVGRQRSARVLEEGGLADARNRT